MKKEFAKFFLLIVLIFFRCSTSTQKESDNTDDTVAAVSLQEQEEVSASNETTAESEYTSFDLEDFTKHPFASDYPEMKRSLREDSIIFTIIANDTTHSEYRTILFDSSQIEFLDSDPTYQDELGDLICSSDISSTKFHFNQGITIGMSQNDFLISASMDETNLMQDAATGYKYLRNEIPFADDGHWQVTIWFNNGIIVRIQSEISPCFFEYGD